MLIDQKRPSPRIPKVLLGIKIAVPFLLLAPAAMFCLIVLKGLPDFAALHPVEVLAWTYSVTWKPAVVAAVLLAGVVVGSASRTTYFHWPYDFGRALSLGAVAGALIEAFSTWIYRAVSHRLFSDFWIAGATIVGSVVGGVVVAIVLWNLSNSGNVSTMRQAQARPGRPT